MNETGLHERIQSALSAEDDEALATVMSDAHAADIAELFPMLGDDERSRIIYALPPRTAAEVVILLGEAVFGDVVEQMDPGTLSELVAELPPDDAADVIEGLTEAEGDRILERIPAQKSEKIKDLRNYPEYTAGRIMTTEVVSVPRSATIADARRAVREVGFVDEVNDIYVIDDDRRLIGTLALRKLVTHADQTPVGDVFEPDAVHVRALDEQETVLQVIRKYGVSEAAVVDENDRLLGRITHDDLFDVAAEEAEEDLLRMAGTDTTELETSSVFRAARIRLTWLLPCMFGMLGSPLVIIMAGEYLPAVLFAAMAPFVPLVGAMGGNAGIQISTVIIRGFASGDLTATIIGRAIAREGRISLALAPVCGIVAFALVSGLLPLLQALGVQNSAGVHRERVALAVGLAMTAAILVAAVLGIALPFAFRRLGVDPAIASGPLVTTLNDAVSVSIYMLVTIAIAQ